MLTDTDMDTGSHFASCWSANPPAKTTETRRLAARDQRISTRYTITGIGATDTADYIRHHLKFAGRSDPLFSDDAIGAIHQAARGYPRPVTTSPRGPGACRCRAGEHRRPRRRTIGNTRETSE